MKKLTIIALGTLLMSSSAAFANELATGPYIGGSISISKMSTQNGFPIDLSGGYIPLRAFIGYRFNDHFSAEVGYDSIEEKNDTLFDMSTIEMQGGDAAIVVNKLFDKHFNVYAKAGAALINAKEQSNEFPDMNSNVTSLTPEIGGGVDYYFTKHFALGITGNYYVGTNKMPGMWSTGIRTSYTF